ncbi:MAG: hypothetical protein JO257_36385 [Deltaproteobacteria bacterium]|nr:hypothetical protein [Deltaproteobacteria bacterium]
MKADDPGFLDVKLTIVTKEPAAWLEAVTALGEAGADEQNGEWQIRRVTTSAKIGDRILRVSGYVGPPTADVTVGWVASDRVVSDGTTEIPDVSIAVVPRVTGAPGKETLQTALKEVLRDAASAKG